jgi:hypothetical protein
MLTVYDNQGEGWSAVNTKRYFWSEDPWEDTSQQQPLITTLHQFEENLILLCTMHEIKKVDPKKHSCRLFCICCFLKNYDRRKTAIKKRHKTLFKDQVNHHYDIAASNELVMTLPFQFVDDLKTGVWQRLPTSWLNTIQRKVKNAQNNSI